MIPVVRHGQSTYDEVAKTYRHPIEDNGEFLLSISPVNADYLVIATPERHRPGYYSISTVARQSVSLRLRTPIPLFDPSPMGGRDAAITAARAASTPTEELKDERTHPTPAICCGG